MVSRGPTPRWIRYAGNSTSPEDAKHVLSIRATPPRGEAHAQALAQLRNRSQDELYLP